MLHIPFAIVTPALLALAFLLLLLVTLSVPIIKTIFLFRLTAAAQSGFLDVFDSSAGASVTFGVFGWCSSGIDASVFGHDFDTAAECSKRHLGYTFDDRIAKALHIDNFEKLISKTLTGVLALHPVVAVLTFITLLISLFMLRRGSNGTSRLPSLVALIVGLTTAVLTTIVFLIDVILVAVVRKHVHNDTDGVLTLAWGSAVWLTLVAAILLWIANVGSCAGVCGGNRRRTADAEKY